MPRIDILNTIFKEKVVAIIRLDEEGDIMAVVDALAEGGVKVLEITMGTPGALKWIAAIARERPELTIGAGSVLDANTANMAIQAGAQFIVTPITKIEIIDTAHRYDVPVLMGAFSPSEILSCFEAGADIVKVFPAEVLGMQFIRAVKAPMPQLPLMPTGGVTVDNASEWIKAGACALGVGSALVSKQLVREKNFTRIRENAQRMRKNLSL